MKTESHELLRKSENPLRMRFYVESGTNQVTERFYLLETPPGTLKESSKNDQIDSSFKNRFLKAVIE